MINLHGKTLIFGDLHLGIKNDSLSRLFVDVNFVKHLLEYIHSNNIENIIFLGDWFNSRESINTITLSVGYELISLLAKNVRELVFILGNHDLESNSYQNVSSVIGYDSIKNLHLIKEPTEVIVNRESGLFVPWGFAKVGWDVAYKYKYMFGHFNLPGSVIRHNRIAFADLNTLNEPILSYNDARTFCNYLDDGGVCFCGHIHCRSEQSYHQHRVIFVGSPFELTFGETNISHGFYVLSDMGNIDFVEIKTNAIPKHVMLKISDCFDENGKLKNADYFKNLKGNIVKKIIDKDLSSKESLQLNELLNDLNVFEFAQVEYGALNPYISEGENSETSSTTQPSALTLESYFDTIIKAIDQEIIKASGLSDAELKECFNKYVKRISE